MNRFLVTSIIQVGLALVVSKLLNTTDLTVYFATAYLLANWHYWKLSEAVDKAVSEAVSKTEGQE